MLMILAIAALAYGFARVLDAPRIVTAMIPLGAVLAMASALLFLPPDHAMRQSVSGSVQLVLIFAIIGVPLLVYMRFLKRLRQAREPQIVKTSGDYVQITDDRKLQDDVQALILEGAPSGLDQSAGFSVLKRRADGGIAATGRCQVTGDLAFLSNLHLSDGMDRESLLRTLEDEARRHGARRLQLDIASWQKRLLPLPAAYREIARVALGPDSEKLIFVKDPL